MCNDLKSTLLRAVGSSDVNYSLSSLDTHCRYLSALSRAVSSYKFEAAYSKKRGNYVDLVNIMSIAPVDISHLNALINYELKREELGYYAEFVQRERKWGSSYAVEAVKIGYQDADDPLVKVFTI